MRDNSLSGLVRGEYFNGKNKTLKESLDEIRTNLSIYIQYQAEFAKLTRAKYDALIAEGFTEQQAIQLCR